MKNFSKIFLFFSIACLTNVNASTVFFDDFESDLSQWSSNRSGVIVTDPIEADNSLSFSLLSSGGDIVSIPINNPTGQYILSFDYLGTCGNSDCGGFIGYEPGDVWVAGTGSFRRLYDLEDTGQWEHYSLSFTGPLSISLQVEDFSGSGGVAGDVYFDNIKVDAVPLPSAIWLFGAGLIGLAGIARRKKEV
jgi:hypothetical protein